VAVAEQAEAALGRDEAAASQAQRAQAPAAADERVDASGRPARPEKTASIAAPTPVARVVSHVGQLANGFWKKFQSNKGQILTEWVMIAGLFGGLTVFLISIFR
jgi:hypothetical protein